MKPYIALTKPRITWLILMSTAIGYLFGAKSWHLFTLLHTIVGTGMIASGTAALNQWVEREADGKMRRTQARPLPSGQLNPTRALIFAIAISVIGFAELVYCEGARGSGRKPIVSVIQVHSMWQGLHVPTHCFPRAVDRPFHHLAHCCFAIARKRDG